MIDITRDSHPHPHHCPEATSGQQIFIGDLLGDQGCEGMAGYGNRDARWPKSSQEEEIKFVQTIKQKASFIWRANTVY